MTDQKPLVAALQQLVVLAAAVVVVLLQTPLRGAMLWALTAEAPAIRVKVAMMIIPFVLSFSLPGRSSVLVFLSRLEGPPSFA